MPIHILWDDERHPINLPTIKELRFEPGTTIGGIVQDEAGHPIEGATVNVHGPPTETDRPNCVFSLGEHQDGRRGPMAVRRCAHGPGRALGEFRRIRIIEAMACVCRATSTA